MILRDQAALVTGGGAGIGEATARLLAENGAAVMVGDWNEESAKATAAAIGKAGGRAAYVKCDVARQAQAQRAVDMTVETFGRIDILINNAGIARDATALKMTPEQWDEVIGVNLSGVFYCSQAAGRHMRERGYGRIVNASSISCFGNFGQTNYAATKAGLVGMTRTMAIELGKYGITVNAIAPGFIKTAMTDGMPEEIRDASIKRIPVGRIGQPEDIARIYLFLVSPDSGFITGGLVVADGGQTLVH